VAAFLVALDPVLLVQARSVMTETLAAFLLAGALAALADEGWKSAAKSGVWLGLAALCRPSTLACGMLMVLAALLLKPGGARARLGRSAAMLAAVVLVLMPWAIRNAVALGETVWTTTHGGYTLALANNPAYYRDVLDGPPGAVWSGPGQEAWFREVNRTYQGLSEPEADRALRRDTVRFIREHPRAFLRASFARLGRFWGLAPAGAVYRWPLRVATLAWTLPFWLAVALGLMTRGARTWPAASAVAQIVALSTVHAAFWTDLRMRAPVVPALALIASQAARSGGLEALRWGGKKNPWRKCFVLSNFRRPDRMADRSRRVQLADQVASLARTLASFPRAGP
jgi:hypothetical protein